VIHKGQFLAKMKVTKFPASSSSIKACKITYMLLQGGARNFSLPPFVCGKKRHAPSSCLNFYRARPRTRRFFPINGVRRAKVLLAYFCGVCVGSLVLPLR
jgi:hypothetical protein